MRARHREGGGLLLRVTPQLIPGLIVWLKGSVPLLPHGVKMSSGFDLSNQIQRTVRFYRIYEQQPKVKILRAGTLWKEGFESLFEGEAKNLKIGEVKFQIHQGYTESLTYLCALVTPCDIWGCPRGEAMGRP